MARSITCRKPRFWVRSDKELLTQRGLDALHKPYFEHPTRISMSRNTKVDWKAIARKRWPLFKIQGEEPFVAIPRGEGSVFSFTTALERSTHAPPNSEFLTLRPPGQTRKAGAD